MTIVDLFKKWRDDLNKDDIVVTSTGYVSREVYRIMDRPLNFYMMGSMSCALAIGMGIALNTKRRVVVFNGDGSVLMSLGSLVTCKRLNLQNLVHVILDNNCHASTGGQKTNSHLINFSHLCRNTLVYQVKYGDVPPRIPLSPKEIKERFIKALGMVSR